MPIQDDGETHPLAEGALDQAKRLLRLQDDARSQCLVVEQHMTMLRRVASGDCGPLPAKVAAPEVAADIAPSAGGRPRTLILSTLITATVAATAGLIASLNAASPPDHGMAVVAGKPVSDGAPVVRDVALATAVVAAGTQTAAARLPADTDARAGAEPVAGPGLRAAAPAGEDFGQTVYAARFASVPASERACLARAIYYESRGEPSDGQIAVAQVILNRARSRKWPNTICGVVNQGVERGEKCQFSFACNTRLAPPAGVLWEEAGLVAEQAVRGQAWLRELMEATHYHTTSVAPVWRLGLVAQATIGSHVFYRETAGLREAPRLTAALTTLAAAKAARASLKPAVKPLDAAKASAMPVRAETARKPSPTTPGARPAPAPSTSAPQPDWRTQVFQH